MGEKSVGKILTPEEHATLKSLFADGVIIEVVKPDPELIKEKLIQWRDLTQKSS